MLKKILGSQLKVNNGTSSETGTDGEESIEYDWYVNSTIVTFI